MGQFPFHRRARPGAVAVAVAVAAVLLAALPLGTAHAASPTATYELAVAGDHVRVVRWSPGHLGTVIRTMAGADEAVYSPDGASLALLRADGIDVGPADGTTFTRWIALSAASRYQSLAWSPDGTKLAFVVIDDTGDSTTAVASAVRGAVPVTFVPATHARRIAWATGTDLVTTFGDGITVIAYPGGQRTHLRTRRCLDSGLVATSAHAFAVTCSMGGEYDVAGVVGLRGGVVHLTDLAAAALEFFSFTPDGSRLVAVMSSTVQDQAVVATAIDGSGGDDVLSDAPAGWYVTTVVARP